MLEGEATIVTFDNKVKLNIELETLNETKVKGKGFSVNKKEKQFENLYIIYQINTPVNLSKKELFIELAKLR